MLKIKLNIIFSLISIWSLILHQALYAQNSKIDSLITLLNNTKHDTEKVNILVKIGVQLKNNNIDSAQYYINKARQIAEHINWKTGIARSYQQAAECNRLKNNYEEALRLNFLAINIWKMLLSQAEDKDTCFLSVGLSGSISNLGVVYKEMGNFNEALKCFTQSIEVDERVKNTKGLSINFGNMGNVCHAKGNYVKALEYHFKALTKAEMINEKKEIARHLGNIGITFKNMKELDKALTYFTRSLKMNTELNIAQSIIRDLVNIGNVYRNKGEFKTALNYYFRGLDYLKTSKNEKLLSNLYSNIGNLYLDNDKLDSSYHYFNKALAICKKIKIKDGYAINLGNIGSIMFKKGNLKEAEKLFLKSLELYDSLGLLLQKSMTEQELHLLYSQRGDYKMALYYYKKHIGDRDSISNQENTKKQTQLEMQYEFDKKETAAKAEQEKKDAIAAAEKQRQQVILILISGVLLLVIVFAIFVFRSLRVTQKQKSIIETQKELVENQKLLVEEKQKEILDSIHYAKRIQQSLLPTEKYIQKKITELKK